MSLRQLQEDTNIQRQFCVGTVSNLLIVPRKKGLNGIKLQDTNTNRFFCLGFVNKFLEVTVFFPSTL